MGLAIAALILHEITPDWDHGGNKDYFSLATRLRAILENTDLPPNDSIWRFAAGLLVGMFRKTRLPIDSGPMPARTRPLSNGKNGPQRDARCRPMSEANPRSKAAASWQFGVMLMAFVCFRHQ